MILAVFVEARQLLSLVVRREFELPDVARVSEEVHDPAAQTGRLDRVLRDLFAVGIEEEGDGIRALVRAGAAVYPGLLDGDFDGLGQGVGDVPLVALTVVADRVVRTRVSRLRIALHRREHPAFRNLRVPIHFRHAVGVEVALLVRVGEVGVLVPPLVARVNRPLECCTLRRQDRVGHGFFRAVRRRAVELEGDAVRPGVVGVVVVLPGLRARDGDLAHVADGGRVGFTRVLIVNFPTIRRSRLQHVIGVLLSCSLLIFGQIREGMGPVVAFIQPNFSSN